MGMQIATLAMGNNTLAAPQDSARERRISLSVEQGPDTSQNEAAIPGSQRSGSIDLNQTTSNLDRVNLAFDRRLQFIMDQESSEITVKVIDRETDKVIKVLPPEELQRLHSGIRETLGFLFDRTV